MAYRGYTSKSYPAAIIDLGGGLNSTASPLALADNESSKLLNVDFDVFGSMRSRDGYTALNTSVANTGAGNGIYDYSAVVSGASTLSTQFVSVFGDELFKMDDLDGTWDGITLSGATITSGANNLCSFAQLNDTLNITNGVDPPIKWQGTGNAVAADVPSGLTDANYNAIWQNYMFYGKVQVSSTWYYSRFYWSNLKDETTWTATDWIDVAPGDGDSMSGLYPFGDRLVVFKYNSIYNVFFTGDSDVPFIVKKSNSPVGCISHWSVQRVNNLLYFLSYDGIYAYDGNNSVKISDRINDTLLGYATGRFEYATSAYVNSRDTYYLAFTTSGGSTHNRIITYNTVKQAFAIWDGIAANYLATLKTSGEERLYFQDYNGYCYRLLTGDDDYPLNVQTAIDSYWYSKWFAFDDLVDKKGILHVVVYHEIVSNNIVMVYAYDLDSSDAFQHTFYMGTSADTYGSALYGSATYAQSGGKIERRDLKGRGRVFRIGFKNSTLAESFKIYGIGFYPHLETVG